MPRPAEFIPVGRDLSVASAGLRAAYRISLQSLIWTVLASSAAIAVGAMSGSGVLIAFGAIGFVDALGSAALVYHFRHALRREQISARREEVAHQIVIVGLTTVGFATFVVSAARLSKGSEGNASGLGVLLAAVSLLVLTGLSVRKRAVARRVASAALRADGHLSAVGAILAATTLAGTVATQQLRWHWADAAAAVLVGGGAMVLGVISRPRSNGVRIRVPASRFTTLGFILVGGVAALDALLGHRVTLIGLLVLGPACAVISLRPRPTFAVSVWAVVVAVALGAPDGIWATSEHVLFVGVVAVVGVVNTAAVAIVAARMARNELR